MRVVAILYGAAAVRLEHGHDRTQKGPHAMPSHLTDEREKALVELGFCLDWRLKDKNEHHSIILKEKMHDRKWMTYERVKALNEPEIDRASGPSSYEERWNRNLKGECQI